MVNEEASTFNTSLIEVMKETMWIVLSLADGA
jgi:hypothetical protein